ncbi:MAG: M42 family metallopeptidase, partial [Candidatus Omnitrophica bacterium]|nr:M42 family metallopeptidase [Candidatus Omnitrophota bacterium]
MEKKSLEFLKGLVETISPSGFEEEAVKVWKERTKDFADEVKTDVHGNTIAVLNKNGKPRIMLAGHIDEIGYMVKYIDKEGYVYFSTIGGVDLHLVPGQRVWLKTKKAKVLGVVGRKPKHLLEEEEKKKISKIEELYIDIGAKDEKEARSILDIGDPAVPAVGFEALRDDLVVARGFDDKAGAFIVSETLRLLSQEKIKSSVYGVATVQEEIGLRGAKTSAYGISPDIGIAIDVTFATDCPGMDKRKIGDIKLGGGPVINRGPNVTSKVFDLLIETAEQERIPYQVDSTPGATPTDANVLQLTKAGVATGLVSIPNRYMHTPVEVVSLKDLENISKLLSSFILRID